MSRGEATEFTTATETIVQAVKTALASAQTTCVCSVCSATAADDIRHHVFGLRGPAAVVLYMGSDWRVEPLRRRLKVAVVLVFDNAQIESGGTSVRGMLDSAVTALDVLTGDQYIIRIQDDAPVDMGPGRECIQANFTVEDY
jgi:hypothetical protein